MSIISDEDSQHGMQFVKRMDMFQKEFLLREDRFDVQFLRQYFTDVLSTFITYESFFKSPFLVTYMSRVRMRFVPNQLIFSLQPTVDATRLRDIVVRMLDELWTNKYDIDLVAHGYGLSRYDVRILRVLMDDLTEIGNCVLDAKKLFDITVAAFFVHVEHRIIAVYLRAKQLSLYDVEWSRASVVERRERGLDEKFKNKIYTILEQVIDDISNILLHD